MQREYKVDGLWQVVDTMANGDELYTSEFPFNSARGFQFETCLFRDDGSSTVLGRYVTKAQAQQGHNSALADL